jgi:AraC-like DNA-binding protein
MQSPGSIDNGWLTRIDANGFEEAAEQAASMGELRYVQLEPGPAHVQGAIARLGRVVAGRFAGDRNTMVTLETAPGRFMLCVATRGAARLGTADIHPGDVIASRATQIVAFHDRTFLPVSISMDVSDLEQVAADLGLDLTYPLQPLGILRAPGGQAMTLDQLVQGIIQVAEVEPNALQSAGVMTALDETVLQWCAALLHKLRACTPTVESPISRRRAALRAREFIDAHLDEPLSLARLCRASYACARALEYGFREMFEVSPMAYVRFARLSRVRRDLYFAKKSRRTVTRLATRWGFGHLGQFSRDYHSLFGELPSATLARSMLPGCRGALDACDEDIEPVMARSAQLVGHARN